MRFRPELGRSVTIDRAAVLMGCCRRTVYNRIADGRLQTIRTKTGTLRVLLETIAWPINQRKTCGPRRRPIALSTHDYQPTTQEGRSWVVPRRHGRSAACSAR